MGSCTASGRENAIAALSIELVKAHQLRRRNPQGTSEPTNVHETDISMASFYIADVTPGDPAFAGEFLLRPSLGMP